MTVGDSSILKSVISGIDDSSPGCMESLGQALLVTPPMACRRGSGFRSAASDSSLGLRGELASAFAVGDSYMLESELVGNSSLLRGGSGHSVD